MAKRMCRTTEDERAKVQQNCGTWKDECAVGRRHLIGPTVCPSVFYASEWIFLNNFSVHRVQLCRVRLSLRAWDYTSTF